VFEVGCAYGFWLEFLSEKGIPCAGIDVCTEAVAYAARELGQHASAGDFLDLKIELGQYEAFCMWDTIEHLPHPELFVERIARLLPPGGWFFATTGDIGSRLAQRRGPRWRMIHPPTHLQYFSRDTLSRLLIGHGLQVRAVRSVPVYRNLRSVLANLQVLGGPTARRVAAVTDRIIPDRLQERVGVWLDLGDIMLVCAQKT
jgi:SAM-dependent methyltransferase